MVSKKSKPITVDAIVPCFNEGPRVGRVLEVLSSSKHLNKVIFVDDGSMDNSIEKAKKFPNVKIVCLKKNQGKGQAVKEGLKHVESEVIFLCDADLAGLKEKNIQEMIKTYQKHPDALVVGLRQKIKSKTGHWLRKNLLPLIAGERILKKSDLKTILDNPLSYEYGLETYMNYYYRRQSRPIIKILLVGVNHIPKTRKESYGLKPLISEGINITQKYLSVYAKELPKDIYNSMKTSIFQTKEKSD